MVVTLGFLVGCSEAQNLGTFLAFRLITGIAGSGPGTIGGATIADVMPPENRGKAMSAFGMGLLMGPVLGPLMVGFAAEYLSWRWVFRILYITVRRLVSRVTAVLTFRLPGCRCHRNPLLRHARDVWPGYPEAQSREASQGDWQSTPLHQVRDTRCRPSRRAVDRPAAPIEDAHPLTHHVPPLGLLRLRFRPPDPTLHHSIIRLLSTIRLQCKHGRPVVPWVGLRLRRGPGRLRSLVRQGGQEGFGQGLGMEARGTPSVDGLVCASHAWRLLLVRLDCTLPGALDSPHHRDFVHQHGCSHGHGISPLHPPKSSGC